MKGNAGSIMKASTVRRRSKKQIEADKRQKEEEKHQIEQGLNKALNRVLRDMPYEPFSTMAVSLIDLNPSNPQFKKLHAKPAYLCDFTQETLQIDVYLTY